MTPGIWHDTPGRDVDWIHGICWLESVAGQRARQMNCRRACHMHSRRACHMNGRLVWVSCGRRHRFPHERQRRFPRERRRRSPRERRAWRSRGRRRAWGTHGQRTRGTRGDPTELPRRLAVGYNERRLPCRGTNRQEQNKTFKNEKTKRGEGVPLTVWVWSSVTVHTAGRNKEHGDED